MELFLSLAATQLKGVIMNDKLYLLVGVDKDLELSPQEFVASLDTLSTHQLNWQSVPNEVPGQNFHHMAMY